MEKEKMKKLIEKKMLRMSALLQMKELREIFNGNVDEAQEFANLLVEETKLIQRNENQKIEPKELKELYEKLTRNYVCFEEIENIQ